jgi:hypothetical protein
MSDCWRRSGLRFAKRAVVRQGAIDDRIIRRFSFHHDSTVTDRQVIKRRGGATPNRASHCR